MIRGHQLSCRKAPDGAYVNEIEAVNHQKLLRSLWLSKQLVLLVGVFGFGWQLFFR